VDDDDSSSSSLLAVARRSPRPAKRYSNSTSRLNSLGNATSFSRALRVMRLRFRSCVREMIAVASSRSRGCRVGWMK
jgi:hypothetical protein